MDPPSKNDSQQRELISVQQQAPARSLQGSPSHTIGALNYPRSADAQDGDSQPLSPSLIRFYDKDKPYYSFTNFSPDPVYLNQQRYPTSEHLFQALKFIETYPELAESIRTCGESPRIAFDKALEYQSYVRTDWRKINVTAMKLVLRAKFSQHTHLMQMLIDTGDAQLVEDSPYDAFWGIGRDGTGQNQLGQLLQEIRAELHLLGDNLNLGKLQTVRSTTKAKRTQHP